MGERWVGIQKIRIKYIRGCSQGGVDMNENNDENLEETSGQALIDKNKKIKKE